FCRLRCRRKRVNRSVQALAPTAFRLEFGSMRIRARVLLLVLLAAPLTAASLPTPESVLGFRPGADYKLATYDQSLAYFKRIADATKYVKLIDAGTTTQGRPM